MTEPKGGFSGINSEQPTEIEMLKQRVSELEKESLGIGWWYDRSKNIWLVIIKIVNFNEDFIEISILKGETKLVKQTDCIIFKHPYYLTKKIEQGGK